MQAGPYLQSQGIGRRAIIDHLANQTIWVNGKHIESFRHEVDLGDMIRLGHDDGNMRVFEVVAVTHDFQLILVNKPAGYVVSHADGHNPTLFSLLPDEYTHGWYFIGRLDLESRGLVILTNKSDLVHKREHPRFAVPKRYIVRISKPLDGTDAATMRQGVYVDEFGTAAKKGMGDMLSLPQTKYIYENGAHYLDIVLTEGKKRHIRRVCRFLGYKVLDLMRTHIGPYALGDLREGAYRVCELPDISKKLTLPPSIASLHKVADKVKVRDRSKRAKPKRRR